MVANVGKMKGKIAENGYNNRTFAKAMEMSEVTLKRKMTEEKYEFSIGESVKARDLLNLNVGEYLDIFINF